MNRKTNTAQLENGGASNAARQTLYLAAAISTVFGVLYLLGLAGKFIVDGSIHSVSAPAVQMVSAAIGLLWDITLVILFAALRRQVPEKGSFFAELGLIFMVLLGAASSINWYVQLALVPRIAQTDNQALLALVDIHGDSSIMYAIEHLAWGLFYGLATIFMGLAIDGGKLGTWIRWLLVVGGVLSILHVFGIIFNIHLLLDLGYLAAGVLLPITTLLMAIGNRKSGIGN